MKLINILSMAFVVFMFGNANSTQLLMNFTNSFYCLVQCGSQSKIFKNNTELSNELNEITGEYLKIDSVNSDNSEFNTIVFHGIHNSKQCKLSLNGSNNFKPRLVFNCGNSNLNISRLSVGNDITALYINANGCSKAKINELANIANATVKHSGNVLIGRFIHNSANSEIELGHGNIAIGSTDDNNI